MIRLLKLLVAVQQVEARGALSEVGGVDEAEVMARQEQS